MVRAMPVACAAALAQPVITPSGSAFGLAPPPGYAIEIDLQFSRDGVPMVFHDQNLDRLTGEGRLSVRTEVTLD